MVNSPNTYSPGPRPNTVVRADGQILEVPQGWVLLPPGDAALTRRVKAAGAHWMVVEKKGRRVFSCGVWTSANTIAAIQAQLAAERATDTFAKRKIADARRRENQQSAYVEDFCGAIIKFLDFHPQYGPIAEQLAKQVTAHATPVGSGTVARTTRIPIEQRAEAAVVAWLRHQTTGYDGMVIPRVKGKRREVRRLLASRSHELLQRYRSAQAIPETCPLQIALRAIKS